MNQQKDLRILQVVQKQSKSMEFQEHNVRSLVPMQSVKLFHPQQPNDSNYQDLPSDVKLFFDHGGSYRKVEEFEEMQKENHSYSIDTKYFKRTNTDVNFSDSFGNYFKSIKLLLTDKSKPIGSLVNQLLSDERKGKKILKKSVLGYIVHIFEQLIFFTHLSILILNPAIQFINLPISIQAIQIIILLAQTLIKCNCKQNGYKMIDILTFLLQVLLMIVILFLTIKEARAEITIFFILLLTWLTIYKLSQFYYFYRYYRIIQLIFVLIQQCHTFTCLIVMLQKQQEMLIFQYIYNFQSFFGNFMGLGGQNGEDQVIIYYILLIISWTVFWIIRVMLFQEFYLQIQQEKILHKEQQTTIEFIQLLKQLKFANTNKLCQQILDIQSQEKQIKKIKDQNQLLNHFPLKDSLRQQILSSDKLQLLLNFGLFKKLSTQTLNHLVNHLEVSYFQNEDIIVQQQRDDHSIFFIKKGIVKVYYGKQIALLGENEYFGELSFLTGLERSASAKCKGECCILKLRSKDFFASLQDRDLEIVNYIKDEIVLNNNFGSIGINCYNCMSSNHCIRYCPQLHLCPNKEKIIIEYLQPYSQRRRSFQRVKSKHPNTISQLRNYQVKCQEFQDDQGFVSSLGETDHTNYQQNQSFQTYTQQSSIPQKILGNQGKVLMRPSTLENVPSIDCQDSLKEQQFREIDQLFIRTANPKATTSTAGFGQKENNSQKSPKLDVNNTISEIQSEDSSEQGSSLEEEDISANSRNTHEYRIKGLRQSTYKSDRSQFRSGVSSISMSYTPKQQSQLSLLNTLNQKSDNNVVGNSTSQKQISPLQLREKEDKQNTLTSNLLQLPPKKSLMNPISQLNYEISPFVAHSQILVKSDQIWCAIESDKIQSYHFYYPHYNIKEVLIRYQCIQKGFLNKNGQKFTKYNTL